MSAPPNGFSQSCSPDEVIFNLKDNEVMRLCYQTMTKEKNSQQTELYVWICPATGFFDGLIIIENNAFSAMSERPLNTPQLLQFINNTSFREGSDMIEVTTGTKIEDLKRLRQRIQKS